MGLHVVELSDASFEAEVLQSSKPVLVDFWAPWCGPCRRLAPVVEELAAEYSGTAKVAKLNTDDNQDKAGEYGVSALPTIMIFKGGQVVDRFLGLQDKSRLQAALDAAIG